MVGLFKDKQKSHCGTRSFPLLHTVSLVPLFFLCLLAFPLHVIDAQEENNARTADERLVDTMLDSALSAAELGQWELALEWLEKAEELMPADKRIPSYRESIIELSSLDEAQNSWARGEPAGVNVPGDASGDEPVDDSTPKFVIDRGDLDSRNAPAAGRDNMRLDLSIKLLSVDPLDSTTVGNWSSPSEFFYSSMGVDLRYWFPFLNKSFGLNFRSAGYSWIPGDVDRVFNTLDLGLNLRGFLLETYPARLEIGLDLGGAVHSLKPVGAAPERTVAVFLGLWAADPLFFHLFNANSLQNLIIAGELRIYTSTAEELLETINYRIDASWRFPYGRAGIRMDWMDFSADLERRTVMSFGVFGGFRY